MFKNCILYTNCIGSLGIQRMFSIHPEIKSIKHYNNYIVDEYPSDEELELCDLFIFQYSKNKSIEKYTSKLPLHCKQISFPYIYDDGTFSTHQGTGGFAVIDKLLKNGLTVENIIKMYDNNEIDFELKERRRKSIEILKSNEENCSIKISDFIEENRHRPIFFTHNHPTMILLMELCNRICKHLNIIMFSNNDYGWLYKFGIHLDLTAGFCKYPYNKLESTMVYSILNMDKYSIQNQVTCLHDENGIYKDFYIVSDEFTKRSIIDYIRNKLK